MQVKLPSSRRGPNQNDMDIDEEDADGHALMKWLRDEPNGESILRVLRQGPMHAQLTQMEVSVLEGFGVSRADRAIRLARVLKVRVLAPTLTADGFSFGLS